MRITEFMRKHTTIKEFIDDAKEKEFPIEEISLATILLAYEDYAKENYMNVYDSLKIVCKRLNVEAKCYTLEEIIVDKEIIMNVLNKIVAYCNYINRDIDELFSSM